MKVVVGRNVLSSQMIWDHYSTSILERRWEKLYKIDECRGLTATWMLLNAHSLRVKFCLSSIDPPNGQMDNKPNSKDPAITFRNDTRFASNQNNSTQRPSNRRFSLQGVGVRPSTSLAQTTSISLPYSLIQAFLLICTDFPTAIPFAGA